MPWMIPAAIFGSSLLGASAASKAADTQAGAADRAAELQYKMYQENVQRQQPFLEAGVGALNKLTAAADYKPFGMDKFQADPGYAFRLSEGQKALDRQAAARGGLISGAALKAATRYGQDMGSQEYMNAFNRYQTERAATLNPLQSLAGVGMTTANTLGGAGQSYGAGAGEAYQNAANARASGYVGGANAFTGGLGSYLNYSQGQDYLNRLRPPGGGSSLMSEPYAGYNASIGLRS
jgi:hypothetical protein